MTLSQRLIAMAALEIEEDETILYEAAAEIDRLDERVERMKAGLQIIKHGLKDQTHSQLLRTIAIALASDNETAMEIAINPGVGAEL